MTKARFCLLCGAPLVPILHGERLRAECPACGYVHYVNPIVAAGTLTERQGCVLLVRRGVPPGEDLWGLPAGYAEADETPDQAAQRETLEETGYQVALDALEGIHPFPARGGPAGVLVLYRAHVVGGAPRPGDDAREVSWAPAGELEAFPLAFGTHRAALHTWVRTAALHYGPASPEELAQVRTLAQTLGRPTLSESGETALVAVRAGCVVGYALWHVVPPEGWVGDIVVAPEWRRLGLATRLLDCARAQAQALGVARILAPAPNSGEGLLLYLNSGYHIARMGHHAQAVIVALDLD